MPFVEQRKNIDRSYALCIFEGPVEHLHADMADIRFVVKSAVDPEYFLLIVGLFTSKFYMYPIKNRSLMAIKLALFYEDMSKKRKMEKERRLQTDKKIEQTICV